MATAPSITFLLLHAADVLLGIGIVIVFCAVLLVILSTLATRSSKTDDHHRGGIVTGAFFFIPSIFILLGLSYVKRSVASSAGLSTGQCEKQMLIRCVLS